MAPVKAQGWIPGYDSLVYVQCDAAACGLHQEQQGLHILHAHAWCSSLSCLVSTNPIRYQHYRYHFTQVTRTLFPLVPFPPPRPHPPKKRPFCKQGQALWCMTTYSPSIIALCHTEELVAASTAMLHLNACPTGIPAE